MSARGGKPDSPGNAPKLELWFKSTAGSGILENPIRNITVIASLPAGERFFNRRNDSLVLPVLLPAFASFLFSPAGSNNGEALSRLATRS